MPSIYQTHNLAEAHYKVAVTSAQAADLWVYLAPIPGLAQGAGQWYMTQTREKTSLWLYFTSNEVLADIKIHFVDNPASATWQKMHPLASQWDRLT